MTDYEIEKHPLKPFLPQNGKLLMLGSFPPPKSRWKMDFYYPNYQNDMWRIFGLCFFQDKNYFLDLANKNYHLSKIIDFLNEKGIGIFDTAFEVKRLKGNASDKFLEIVTPTNVQQLLEQMPQCHHIMTTGDKATNTLVTSIQDGMLKPEIGQSVECNYYGRHLILHRMPSSSRAYPLALELKAQAYAKLFLEIGLL